MRVVVSANVLKQQKTGVETYTFELLRHLAQTDIRLTVVASPSVSEQLSQILPSSVRYESKFTSEMLSCSDIVHFPTVRFELRALFERGVSKVATVHDLIPTVVPEHHSLRYRLYFRYALPVLLQRVQLLLTPSDATREDLVRVFGLPREKIVVTPLGSRFPRATEKLEREPIILSVGTIEPRKNTRGTVSAFIELKRTTAGIATPTYLYRPSRMGE